jgi:ATP synthase protein I
MSGTDGGGKDGEGDTFDARLRAARERQGLDKPPGGPKRKGTGDLPLTAFGLGMRVAVELASALALAVAIGWGLDHWLHTAPIFIALFVLLGGAAGVLNVWRLVGPGRKPPD